MRQRILWIDDVRTITMLLVIIGRCTYVSMMTPYGGIDYNRGCSPGDYSLSWKILNLIVTFIYSFHMPLFMMLSGCCFKLGVDKIEGWSSLLCNKYKRLLVPFFFTTLLLAVPIKYFTGYYAESTNVIMDIVCGQFLLMGNSHLWFVTSLFWIFLLFYKLYNSQLTARIFFMPSLLLVSMVATYANNHGIEFLGMVQALKHLLYFSIGFLYLGKLDTQVWGG